MSLSSSLRREEGLAASPPPRHGCAQPTRQGGTRCVGFRHPGPGPSDLRLSLGRGKIVSRAGCAAFQALHGLWREVARGGNAGLSLRSEDETSFASGVANKVIMFVIATRKSTGTLHPSSIRERARACTRSALNLISGFKMLAETARNVVDAWPGRCRMILLPVSGSVGFVRTGWCPSVPHL